MPHLMIFDNNDDIYVIIIISFIIVNVFGLMLYHTVMEMFGAYMALVIFNRYGSGEILFT